MAYYVDWFDCYSSSNDGETWDCVYNHTDVNSGEPDYWDPYNDFYTTGDCSMVAQYCDNNFQPGGGSSPYTTPRNTVRSDGPDELSFLIPTCPADSTAAPVFKAYCAGHVPSGTELTRIRAALTRLHQKGGICDTFATIGDALLSRGVLHVFPQGSYNFGGAAPQGGGSSGDRSWAIISRDLVNVAYDYPHYALSRDPNSGLWYYVTLQDDLAHELDHLNGNPHVFVNYVENKVLTPNEKICSDGDMGDGFR